MSCSFYNKSVSKHLTNYYYVSCYLCTYVNLYEVGIQPRLLNYLIDHVLGAYLRCRSEPSLIYLLPTFFEFSKNCNA